MGQDMQTCCKENCMPEDPEAKPRKKGKPQGELQPLQVESIRTPASKEQALLQQ